MSRPLVRTLAPAAILLALACGGGGGDGPTGGGSGVADVRLAVRTVTLSSINDSTRLVAAAYDENSSVVNGVTFSWRSLTPAVASVLDANGLVRAQANGVTKVVVTGGGKSDTATITVQQATSSVLPSVANATLEVGDTLYVTAQLRDARGTPIAGRAVTWTSQNESIATVNAAGMLVARAIGATNIVATGDGRSATVPITVTGAVGPFIDAVFPDTILPGARLTITGRELTNGGAPTVSIAGFAATVTSSSATQIVIQAPSATVLGCSPTQGAALAVTSGPRTRSRLHPMKTATRRTLAAGESVTLLDANSVKCNELVGAGRYIMSVFNPSATTTGTQPAFRVRGAVSAAAAMSLDPSFSLAPTVVAAPARAAATIDPAQRAADAAHFARLELNRELAQRLGPPREAWDKVRTKRRASGASMNVSAATPPSVGDVMTFRFATGNGCNAWTPVSGRVKYVGTRAIVIEDTQAPRANTMDAMLVAIGQEFDNVQYPILETYFGNPLAFQNQLDNDGHVYMLFTNQVNAITGVQGFVTSCDFYPTDTTIGAAGSNQAEMFYARVASDSTTPAAWLHGIRSTVIHEVKHITSFSERFSRYGRAVNFEQSWLEESTARLSEELFARTFQSGGNGGEWRGNLPFTGSVRCEWYVNSCGDSRPSMMTKHFQALYRYFEAADSLTPIGRVGEGDGTFYGSGWSLVRWSVDHYASNEAAFIRALVIGPQSGVANLAARTGRPFEEMVADWTMANILDDMPGFTAARAQHRHLSWNTPSMMAGLNTGNGTAFPSPFPLLARTPAPGNFAATVASLRGGSAAYFDITLGTSAPPQLLELQGFAGGAPPNGLRVSLVRVQ